MTQPGLLLRGVHPSPSPRRLGSSLWVMPGCATCPLPCRWGRDVT